MTAVDLTTILATETEALRRDVSGLRIALRDAQSANEALRRECERQARLLRLVELECERHSLAVRTIHETPWEAQ